jgi:hypothetical protein
MHVYAPQGSFGNFFGDDDDEGALLFPGDKGFVASEAHAHMYGEFEAPVYAQQGGDSRSNSRGASGIGNGNGGRKSKGSTSSVQSPISGSAFSSGGNKSPTTHGRGMFDSFATSGGGTSGGAAIAAKGTVTGGGVGSSFDTGGGSGAGSHNIQSLQERKLEARLSRRALLIGRRKWLLQLTALGVGGNAGLFGTIPPVLVCLRMQVQYYTIGSRGLLF